MPRLIDANKLIGDLHNHAFLEGDDREIVYSVIQKQPTIGGWISVKDRLPEKQIPVLVYVPPHSDKNELYAEYVGMAYYTYSVLGGYWAGTDGNVYGEIGIIHDPTYWMPMPEPPEIK